MIDINDFGKYRLGLTKYEIKEYLNLREQDLLSDYGNNSNKTSKAIYHKFCEIAGVNTCAVITVNKHRVILMYRHDVERFADKLFLDKETYFD